MNEDPNTPNVEDDTNKSVETEGPIIPTAEELTQSALLQNVNASIEGVDPDAPFGRKKDGTPAKKRGRHSGSAQVDQFARLDSVSPTAPRQARSVPTTQAPAIAVDYRALGETAANLWFNVPQIIFGEDWAPESNEVQPVAKGFTDYFKANGVTEINPTIALLLVLGSYSVVRINKPTVKDRLSKGFQWIKSKIIRNR